MNEKELQNGREFDGEPDEIEETSYSTPPSSTTSHPFNGNNSSNGANNFSNSFNGNNSSNEANNFSNSFNGNNSSNGANNFSNSFNGNNPSNEANNFSNSFNGNNSSNGANNFSNSSNGFQAANAPNGAIRNGKKLSREEERELAGHDGDADELLASEHRIKQDSEGPETRSVSEKPEVRTFSVLMGTGAVLGILGFFWFVFFAPKPVRQQAKTPNPKPTQVSKDESGELKSRLAFQDQQRALEVQPPEPKNQIGRA